MSVRILLLASLIGSLAPLPSRAQPRVSVDPRALDPLSGQPAQPSANTSADSKDKPPARQETRRRSEGARTSPPPARATGRGEIYGPPRPAAASLAPAAPPLPVIPPPIEVPTRPVPPPEPAPAVADAPGEAMPLSDGLRITFGADRADMNAASEGALRKLARDQPPSETVTYTVTAFATPQPDDPSTPRRLALSRALAVRSILIAQGVPSPRIIVKVAPIGAVLASAGKAPPVDPAPPDRVDITRTFQADPPTGPAGPASTTPAGGAKR